jgi:transposase-like protein
VTAFDSGNFFGVRSASNAATNVPCACPACESASITTTSKTPNADSYWRCGACGEIWNVARSPRIRTGASAWR